MLWGCVTSKIWSSVTGSEQKCIWILAFSGFWTFTVQLESENIHKWSESQKSLVFLIINYSLVVEFLVFKFWPCTVKKSDLQIIAVLECLGLCIFECYPFLIVWVPNVLTYHNLMQSSQSESRHLKFQMNLVFGCPGALFAKQLKQILRFLRNLKC